MLKTVSRQPWTCARCIRRQQGNQRRWLVGLARAPAPGDSKAGFAPLQHGDNTSVHDDSTLRKIFDSKSFWKQFSCGTTAQLSGKEAGLLQNRYLTSPAGFKHFSSDALKKCRVIVARVLAAETTQDYKNVVRSLDRLSDQLCRVIDLVDFIRNVHPNPRIQQAAAQAHMLMYEYMNILNTTRGLDEKLKKASSIPEVVASWTEEEKVTARILLRDFAQSAIDGPEENRQRFVEVSNEILQLGSDMTENMAPERQALRFEPNRLKGMDPVAIRHLTKWGVTSIPTYGQYSMLALKTVEDPDVRRELYRASRTASKDSIERVEKLLRGRAELAKLAGHDSFAHLTLSDKMAKTPEAVEQFLNALAQNNKSQLNKDLDELLDIKRADARHGNFPKWLNPWDRDYYTHRLRGDLFASSRPSDVLSAYFSLGTVIQGLSRLFNRLYGIRLVPRETPPGETWNDDVRRLDVIDETEGHIAVLYCDLFQRPNKSPNPAHYTLRCSRQITPDEMLEAQADHVTSANNLADLSRALNDGMAMGRNPHTGTLHQLPTIAFICDFPRPPPSSSAPTLLSLRQLSTLFHEMGHALHSILGRTTLQNVAGTRCATDFAELPSILMEHFAAAPAALALYARHWQTDAPIDAVVVAAELGATKRLLAAQETEAQILFSVLDQRYHAPAVAGAGWDSSAVYHDVYADARYSSAPEPAGTAWQGFFGHLFGYGAVYYSYLFDRAIAGRVWTDVFDKAPLDREAGQRYRDEVLRWGGGRSGWECVAGVLGPRQAWMHAGGEEAMKEVGKWGAGDAGDAGSPM